MTLNQGEFYLIASAEGDKAGNRGHLFALSRDTLILTGLQPGENSLRRI